MIEIEVNKIVNWKQLGTEANVVVNGVFTKGNKLYLIEQTQEEIDKLVIALKTHVPITPQVQPTNQDIMDKLNIIEGMING